MMRKEGKEGHLSSLKFFMKEKTHSKVNSPGKLALKRLSEFPKVTFTGENHCWHLSDRSCKSLKFQKVQASYDAESQS